MIKSITENPESPLNERLVQSGTSRRGEDRGAHAAIPSSPRGRSHGAPARHFKGLSDLRAEVAATGFRLLSEAIEKSDRAAVDNPIHLIVETAQGCPLSVKANGPH